MEELTINEPDERVDQPPTEPYDPARDGPIAPTRNSVLQRAVGRGRRFAAEVSDPRLRQAAARLKELRGRYAGETCFVMGNGPSLNEMDLSRFAGQHVWASNRAYLLFDRIDWRPDFWVAVDHRVVPDIAAELLAVQDELPSTRFFYPDHFAITGVLASRPNTYWYRERPMDLGTLPWGAFSRDPSQHVTSVRTVTIAALQLAVHLGFDPIHLIGCDTSYTVPPTARAEDPDGQLLVSTADDDPNHFDQSYFGAGRKWHDPHVDLMLRHYEHVRMAADQLGVTITNATVGGNLEAFERTDWRDLV